MVLRLIIITGRLSPTFFSVADLHCRVASARKILTSEMDTPIINGYRMGDLWFTYNMGRGQLL